MIKMQAGRLLILALVAVAVAGVPVVSAAPALDNVYFTTPGSTSYTVPSGVERVLFECVGGGAGGGGAAATGIASRSAGAGGGAGAYVRKTAAVAVGDVFTIIVGAGGAGAAAGNNAGAAGNDSSVSGAAGVSLTCGAGFPGNGGPAVNTNSLSLGGRGGTGTGGDVNANGSSGDQGRVFTGETQSGGYGASSYFGDGGFSVVGVSVGSDAHGPGAGGGGASNGNTNPAKPGGDGAAGIIIVWEFGDIDTGASEDLIALSAFTGFTEGESSILLLFLVFLVLSFFQRWLFVSIASVMGILEVMLNNPFGSNGFVFTLLLLVIGVMLQILVDMRDAHADESDETQT